MRNSSPSKTPAVLKRLDDEVVAKNRRSGGAPAARAISPQSGFENFLEKAGKAKPFFKHRHVLREPHVMLTETPRLPGTDGRRMAKSYGNFIWLSDPLDYIRKKPGT